MVVHQPQPDLSRSFCCHLNESSLLSFVSTHPPTSLKEFLQSQMDTGKVSSSRLCTTNVSLFPSQLKCLPRCKPTTLVCLTTQLSTSKTAFPFHKPKFNLFPATICRFHSACYRRCTFAARYCAVSPCTAGIPSSKLSCCVDNNNAIHMTINQQAVYNQCNMKMEAKLRGEYNPKVQKLMDEGINEGWEKKKSRGSLLRCGRRRSQGGAY